MGIIATAFASFVTSAALTASLGFAGCSGPVQNQTAIPTANETAIVETNPQVAGGWTSFTDTTPAATKDERGVFDQATKGLVGVNYELVRVLGTQVVAGTNYLVLCQGTPVTQNPTNQLYLATLYVDLQGNAQLTKVTGFDLTAYLG